MSDNTLNERREVKILVAENDRQHSAVICANLKKVGVRNEIIELKDEKDVADLLLIDEKKRDSNSSFLLVMELHMAKGRDDDFDILKRIKQQEVKGEKKIPVVIVTNGEGKNVIEECRKLGFNIFVKKPITYESLLEVLKKIGLFLMIVDIPVIKCEPITGK